MIPRVARPVGAHPSDPRLWCYRPAWWEYLACRLDHIRELQEDVDVTLLCVLKENHIQTLLLS